MAKLIERRLLEHKLGERVTIDGVEYEVVGTTIPRSMCIVCALAQRTGACMKVNCSPAYRKDRMRVYYRQVK